jgi:hypothetical protein
MESEDNRSAALRNFVKFNRVDVQVKGFKDDIEELKNNLKDKTEESQGYAKELADGQMEYEDMLA